MADSALLVAVKQGGAFFGHAHDIERTCRDGRTAPLQKYSNQQGHNNQGQNDPENTPITSTQHCHGQLSFFNAVLARSSRSRAPVSLSELFPLEVLDVEPQPH